MRDEGLDEITGRIVLRHLALLHEADPAQAPATASEMQSDLPIEARDYHRGKLLVSVKPGRGDRATVTLQPRPSNVLVVNDVLMGGDDGACNAWARWKDTVETRGGPPLQLWVRGRWGAGCAAEDIAYVSPPAEVRFAPELGVARAEPVPPGRLVPALWREAGGRLRGGVVESGEPGPSRIDKGARWTSTIVSPLAEVLREMNKTSNNAAAHGLLLALADAPAAAPPSLRAAQLRMASWLETKGIGEGDIRVDEGSGRSRAERGKPRALVDLLRGAWRAPFAQAFVDSLPIAGVDGTLANRMRHGAASGQAFLKTGTLSDTRALAGYVRARSGKVYAVSAMVNHAQAAKGTPALDGLIEWVASKG
jgi:D-alanyl-D-alanine carboxypeptidase/D-alanyl-D-alanine-endopeptidase (penicillin-binding protein 4)